VGVYPSSVPPGAPSSTLPLLSANATSTVGGGAPQQQQQMHQLHPNSTAATSNTMAMNTLSPQVLNNPHPTSVATLPLPPHAQQQQQPPSYQPHYTHHPPPHASATATTPQPHPPPPPPMKSSAIANNTSMMNNINNNSAVNANNVSTLRPNSRQSSKESHHLEATV